MKNSKEVEKNKLPLEDREMNGLLDKYSNIKGSKNSLFYISLFVLNICILVFAYFFIQNKLGAISLRDFFEMFDYKILLIMLMIYLLIILIKSFFNYLKLYTATRQRRFYLMCSSNIVSNFYNCVTIYNKGDSVIKTKNLVNGDIGSNNALSISYSDKLFGKIAYLIYSIIFLILGACLWIKTINIWIYLLALGIFIYLLIDFMIILSFYSNKRKTISFVGKLCQTLYNLKLVKDYEKLYNKINDKLMLYSKVFNEKPLLIICNILAQALLLFLRGLIIYLALIVCDLGGISVLGEILVKFIMIDMIINALPLPKGLLIVDVLFILLFKSVFTGGNVFFGLLIYKVFEYFINGLMYLIDLSVVGVKNKINKKSTSNKEDCGNITNN